MLRANALPSFLESYRGHLKEMSSRKAKRAALLDVTYGRATKYWPIDIDRPAELKNFNPTNICRWCGKAVAENEARFQTIYWEPHCLVIGHEECIKAGHKSDVLEQQKIDQDCNECRHFSGGQTDKYGARLGFCALKNIETIGYPGGSFCSYPLHDECFIHVKEYPL